MFFIFVGWRTDGIYGEMAVVTGEFVIGQRSEII